MRRRWIVVLVTFVTLLAAQPAAALEGFDPAEWNLVGNARIHNPPNGFLEITSDAPGLKGAAWRTGKQRVAGAWTFSFNFAINPDNGADGFAFVIQDHGRSRIGAGGGGLGYAGLRRSLAVEFDTFGNPELGDPTFDHVSVHTRGRRANSASEGASIGRAQPDDIAGADELHGAVIKYAAKRLTVTVDGVEELFIPIDIPRRLDLTRGKAFIGFTGATGGFSQLHHFLNWSFTRP
jgi:hypothetical protein